MLAEPGTRGAQLPGSSWPPGLPGHRPMSAPCLFLTLLHSAGKVGMGEGWSGCARNFYPQATRERKVVVVINHVKKVYRRRPSRLALPHSSWTPCLGEAVSPK